MSQLFDLNVSNYSLKELLNFFGVDKNDDAASVDRSCNDLKKKIQADPKLGPVTKGKIHDFLNKAVDRLSQSRNATKELFESSSGGSGSSSSGGSSSSSGSDGLTAATITAAIKASAPAPGPTQFMQLKNDVQEHGDNFLITRPSEQLGIAGNFKNGKTALTGAPPGIVNPVAMATIKRALNVDTRFRSNYYSSKSTDFVFNIPYKFENVTSMSVATYELPLTYYAISQQYENNCIIFQWKSAGVDYYDNQYTLLIPDGNYNASFQSGNGSPIESAINGILKGTAMVQQTGLAYTVDRTSGRSIFACNSATDASGNVFPYDTNLTSSSTFDMTTPCLTQTLHMSTSAYAPDVLHANMTVPSLDTLVVNTFASSSSTLPIPEVILANHSEESGPGTGGVGLLIGFPSEYSIVTSVTITNATTSFTITGPPTLTGYYVFYENSYPSPGFWPDLASNNYANVVQVQQNSGMCGGLVFANNSLTFTYVISGVSTTLTYTTPSGINIGDGKQYQEYNGQPPFNPPADFQWGSGGTQSWGTQTGTGTQTYAQWQASGSYQFNSIYKFLYPYSTSSSPSPTNGAFVIWTDPVQACSTELYFSLNDSCGDPIDLSSYANSTLTITDGTNTQTFHVSTVVNTGPGDYWTVTVSDGIGFNIANGAQIQATFTNPALTSPPSPFPSTGAVIWNDLTQACATELYFSPNDSCGDPINLLPYANSTLSITDGTNVQTFNVSSVVDTGPGNYWTVSVSNGMGFNIANGAQIQATFTNPPPMTPPSPFPNGHIIWNNTTQSFSTKIYFSANDANGNPVDLSGFDANKLSITDGVITQTFDVSAVTGSGSPIVWEVDVFNGLGPNMPVNVPVDATFTRPVPTGPPTASGMPSGNVWWNDVVQAFSTILYFSVDDSLSPPGNVDLSTFQNSKLTITDGTNTQTFSVSSITDAGLGSNNYWTVNVSNGAGLNMANCADIKATFTLTTTSVHTPFTGSMRIVFNARAGIDRNVTSSVTTATTNSSFQSDTRPLPLFLGWQLGSRTAVYELGGGTDSAGSTSPGIPQSAVSEGVCLITGPQYVFLCIDDYNNNVNNYYASAYGSSTIAPNIIARLNIKQQINSAGAYGVVSGESLSTSLTYSREYFGPVDIQRIRITLVDDFGRVLDLNNMDWSFALMFECVYSSSMA